MNTVNTVSKTCTNCQIEKPSIEFPHHSRKCLVCVRTLARIRMRAYKLDPAKKLVINRTYKERHPERVKAHYMVHYATISGKLPKANTLTCFDCPSPAVHYDHHEGYENPLSVQPVCLQCHLNRGYQRGEHATKGRRKITPTKS